MIDYIRICDFKSIRDITLHLGPVTVLVGRSGTGKSNVAQAMRFIRNYLISPSGAIEFEGGWQRISPAGVAEPETRFTLAFRVPGSDEPYEYTIGFSGKKAVRQRLGGNPEHQHLHEEILKRGTKTIYHRVRLATGAWSWNVQPGTGNRSINADGAVVGAFPELQDTVDAYAALSKGVGYYHFPSTVLGSHAGNSSAGQQILQQLPGLRDDGSNYLAAMRNLTEDFRRAKDRAAINATLRTMNRTVASVNVDSLTDAKVAWVAHDTNGPVLRLQLEQESDGFRRFYVQLLALYQAPPKLLLLFEEPENAIFPGALSLLAEEFKLAAREGRGQIILTTHSPGLLDSFDVEEVRVVDMREGQTVVGPVDPQQRENVREHLLTTGELLTTDPARIDPGSVQEQRA